MADSIEVYFLGVETKSSGDAITLRHTSNGASAVHVVDGGYLETGQQIYDNLISAYGSSHVDHVVLTHPDRDHANGLRSVLEKCEVGVLWMNRPWIYAEQLLERFETYQSADALRRKLRQIYDASAALEDLAIAKGIPILAPFQGEMIGDFQVLAPSYSRYLDLIVESNKTPEAAEDSVLSFAVEAIMKAANAAKNLVKAAWGDEYFPPGGTSAENEMSVVQTVVVGGRRLLLTGDTGREGLTEAADFLEQQGGQLPGVWTFQVPHHGGRRNVNSEVLDRWLGPKLSELPQSTPWNAICSSAKADEAHPRKSVIRAMMHRGGFFAATEGRTVSVAIGVTRDGWQSLAQAPYPDQQETE
ncbi:ComEC/Rec2 family competence protein [Luteimonas fraxinea]|uniref:ComEC/Rec2 family competence protein n=1 Tax=Luteimonas fraxinea TaxID=2901869 RepID=UPI001E3FFDB3|nr:competence protein ComEC [Luteimonas fraxinea]MCD9126019.1 competence protein ComEC [Luteimonas fraxinea]